MMCYNPACGGVPPTFYETYVRQIQEQGYPKMDGENNGSNPYEQMDDLGLKTYPYFWFNTHIELKRSVEK